MEKKVSVDSGKVGDFWNNKVLEWNPITFTIEFIFRMRQIKGRLLNSPSTRQAIAIPKLLTAIYYRKLNLIPEDYIKAAVITTPIEDQEIAEKIAYEIIFSNPKEVKKKSQNIQTETTKGNDNTEETDLMEDLLSGIMDTDIFAENVDIEEIMDQTLEDISNLMDFINDMYEQAAKGMEPYLSLIDILDRRSNYKNVLGKNIKTLDQLMENIHQIILREKNNLLPEDIKSSINLEWSQDLINEETAPWIKIGAMFGSNHPEFENYLDEIIKNEDVGTAAKSADYLKKMGIDSKKAEDLTNQLVERVEDIMDISEITQVLNSVPNFEEEKIIKQSLKRDMGLSFKISRALDEQFNKDLTNKFFDEWTGKNANPSLSELYQAQSKNKKWEQKVDDFIDSKAKELLAKNGESSKNLMILAQELKNYSLESDYESCAKHFQEKASQVAMKALENAKESSQFKTMLEDLVHIDIKIIESKVFQISKTLAIPEADIIEILGGNFELLLTMIENKVGNFQRYSKVLNNMKTLSQEQINELMNKALNTNNFQALGALGHHNLGKAFGSCESQKQSDASQQLAESLSAGPGDNLLLQWFLHRQNIPLKVKDFVRDLVKDALIKIAINMVSNQRGSGEKGLIPTNKLRIFLEGDDMELIDIDASIENIIMQGKSLDMISAEDLLVMETEKGRVSICFILDISGSMSGMKLAACSIAVMVLIGCLRAEEVAICFFESDTHVVKEFEDYKDLNDIADELLDLTARGGTRVQRALEWGAKQLEQTTSELKVCFLLTDCEFSETENQIVKELESYVNQKVEFILGVNTKSYSKRFSDWILGQTQGKIVYILNIMDIPKVIMEVLEQIG